MQMHTETPGATGAHYDEAYNDIEHHRGSRRTRSSVIAVIREKYGIAEQQTAANGFSIHTGVDYTYRKVKPRHIQLIGSGGTIGNALYVNIGRGVIDGGTASLFLAFTVW